MVPLGEFIFWSTVWGGAIIVAAFPESISIIAQKTGIGKAVDFIMYATIITLFYLQFRLYVKVEKQQQDITLLVRKISLKKKK